MGINHFRLDVKAQAPQLLTLPAASTAMINRLAGQIGPANFAPIFDC